MSSSPHGRERFSEATADRTRALVAIAIVLTVVGATVTEFA
jgi:hypothetical protein